MWATKRWRGRSGACCSSRAGPTRGASSTRRCSPGRTPRRAGRWPRSRGPTGSSARPAREASTRRPASAPVLARIKQRLQRDAASPEILPSGALGKAVSYTRERWPLFERYAAEGNGEVDIDNNSVESAIRPSAVGKKNWLFIGHPSAGQTSAILYTIIESERSGDRLPERQPAGRAQRVKTAAWRASTRASTSRTCCRGSPAMRPGASPSCCPANGSSRASAPQRRGSPRQARPEAGRRGGPRCPGRITVQPSPGTRRGSTWSGWDAYPDRFGALPYAEPRRDR
jgi:hypothetical protein